MSDVLRGRIDLAMRQLELGQIDGAIESLRAVLAEDPDAADAHALLASALVARKRLHAAEHEAAMALTLEPESPLPRLAAGQVATAGRRFDEALEHFEALRLMQPTSAEPLLRLASVHEALDHRDEARELLEKARAVEPDDAEVWSELGFWHLRGNAVDDAERCAARAVELDPGATEAILLQGHVALRRGRLDEAHEHAVWVLRETGGDDGALHLLTMVKARRSKVLGLWWRWNSWMVGLGDSRAIAVLLAAYVVYRFLVIATENAELGDVAELIQVVWLAIVAYTWFAPVIFYRMLRKETGTVELRDF